jgi:hypothetical protein
MISGQRKLMPHVAKEGCAHQCPRVIYRTRQLKSSTDILIQDTNSEIIHMKSYIDAIVSFAIKMRASSKKVARFFY